LAFSQTVLSNTPVNPGPGVAASPVIDLLSQNSAEARSFNPSTHGVSALTELRALIAGTPQGASFRWNSLTPGALVFKEDSELDTWVKGVRPGKNDAVMEVLDATGAIIQSQSVTLCVVHAK
jgi:hypothetical protein